MATLSKNMLVQVYDRYKGISKDRSPEPAGLSPARIAVMVANTIDKPQQALEKIRGTNNLTSVSTLLRAYETSVSVGLVYNRSRNDIDSSAIGSGFMVAPGLFMTNNHVIANKQDAARFGLLMNYQRDLDGNVDTLYRYRFAPEIAFYTSPQLDFTITAVETMDIENQSRPISSFGYLKLLAESGKISKGEFASLIEHPNGKPKQVVLYENSVLYDLNSEFLLYSADTDEGSSGAPLFNYEWVVVALHHAGVPQSLDQLSQIEGSQVEENEFPRAANEGIRISAIMNDLKQSDSTSANALYVALHEAAQAPLRASLPAEPFAGARQLAPDKDDFEGIAGNEPPFSTPALNLKQQDKSFIMNNQKNIIRLNIPLEIHLGSSVSILQPPPEGDAESLSSRDNLAGADAVNGTLTNRQGYQGDFLDLKIELDKLYNPFLQKQALAPTIDGGIELPYTHFSLVMHKVRKMCVITAVNIDGNLSVSLPRNDNWQLDGRMDTRFQLGNTIYTNNDLDRGHMVRREDPNWGSDAQLANADTFHYTNSCPQHKDLNQKTWLSLEDYVLGSAKLHDLKLSVFTGPVLDENYVHYREALVPIQFYKIVAMIKKDGTPSVTGYVLTQKELISGLEAIKTEFVFSAFKTYQVSLEKIEQMTGLDLVILKPYDPLKGALENLPREISEATDIVI